MHGKQSGKKKNGFNCFIRREGRTGLMKDEDEDEGESNKDDGLT